MNGGTDSPLYNPTRTGSALAHRNAPSPLNPNAASLQHSASSDGYDPKGKAKAGESDFLALDMGSSATNNSAPGSDQFMQMQLMDTQQNNYMQQRSTAIESIESTISELGQIFSQLAHMVAEQRETVQRIDDNVMDVVDNVGGAQRELLRYYASVTSNRWLMLKIFGVLIVFFLCKWTLFPIANRKAARSRCDSFRFKMLIIPLAPPSWRLIAYRPTVFILVS